MTTREYPTIPPIPNPTDGARSLVLDIGDHHQIAFVLGDRMPTDRQLFEMRRHIEAEIRRYWTEYGETVETSDMSWRWVR